MELLPPPLIINLASRPDRLISTYRELNKVGLSDISTRIQAVTAETAQSQELDTIDWTAHQNITSTLTSTSILPTWEAVACAMSHLKCYRHAILHGYPFCLIVEDDLSVTQTNKFKYNLINAIRIIKTKQDEESPWLITFGSKVHGTPANLSQDRVTARLQSIRSQFTGLHCYLLNLSACNYLVDHLLPLRLQIDHQIGVIIQLHRHLTAKNIADSGVRQSQQFSSDVQFYFPSMSQLNSCFNTLPEAVVQIIHQYLPSRHQLTNQPVSTQLEWHGCNYPEPTQTYSDGVNYLDESVYIGNYYTE